LVAEAQASSASGRTRFFAFVSVAARHRLITYAEVLRVTKRSSGQRSDSLDVMPDLDEVDASWISDVDPLRLVIARETLRERWEATTAFEREAIATYLSFASSIGVGAHVRPLDRRSLAPQPKGHPAGTDNPA
jgi:hypothetical protein